MESSSRETSPAERFLAASLREILAPLAIGQDIEDSDSLRSALGSLDFFLPEVLVEIHAEWKWESLDEVIPLRVRKPGDRELELWGLAIVISDQTVVPLHLNLRLDAERDQIVWLECEMMADEPPSLRRAPYRAHRSMLNHLANLRHNPEQIAWVYRVAYGEPAPP